MSGCLLHRRYSYNFPATEPPIWASLVERWYQLDAFAFGLPQAAVAFGLADQLVKNTAPHPEFLLLASPEGSNRTDFDFAQSFLKSGVGSPSKFVHTLPNSRSAALLQVLGWSGRLFCLQNDPATLVTAIEQALFLAQVHQWRGWVFGVTRLDSNSYLAHILDVTPDIKRKIEPAPISGHWHKSGPVSGSVSGRGPGVAEEREFRWHARDFEVKSSVDLSSSLADPHKQHQAGANAGIPRAEENQDRRFLEWMDQTVKQNPFRIGDRYDLTQI